VNITFGTPLGNSQLTATITAVVNGQTVTVPGQLSYASAGTFLNVGQNQSEQVTFTPSSSTAGDYTSVTTNVIVNVAQPTLDVSVNPVTITYGTVLADSQLSSGTATFNGQTVPGSFTYASADEGELLTAGTQTVTAMFTPSDSVDYPVTPVGVQVTVQPATPNVVMNEVNITYGTALDNSQLSGTVTAVVNGQTVPVVGTFRYVSAGGTVLDASLDGLGEAVDFIPSDGNDYNIVSTVVVVNVAQAQAQVSVDSYTITYGTALDNSQLNGTATFNGQQVQGSFTFTSAGGTMPNASAQAQSFDVTFTPNDNTDYATVATTVMVAVNQATPSVNLSSSENPSNYGDYVTITAAVFPQTNGTPQGTATFYDGSTVLGMVAHQNVGGIQEASFTTNQLPVGYNYITAMYTDTVDNNFTTATSGNMVQEVDGFNNF
jgi:hypothetical protein